MTLTTPEQPGSEDLSDSCSELVGGLGRLAPKARKIPEADCLSTALHDPSCLDKSWCLMGRACP